MPVRLSDRLVVAAAVALAAVLLSACGSIPSTEPTAAGRALRSYFTLEDPVDSTEMVMFALGLLDVGYRFGGRNPDAGLDCSGMVSYIVEQISGRRLPHNAAQIAGITRPIPLSSMQAGDLVFFNTQDRPHSHMGIYMGDGRFVHAPSSRGRIRIEALDNPYFRTRIDGARSLLAAH